jgi:hypothetical protein
MMEDSLIILWWAFSVVWVGYVVFLVGVSGQQKRIGEQIRQIRVRLQSVEKR